MDWMIYRWQIRPPLPIWHPSMAQPVASFLSIRPPWIIYTCPVAVKQQIALVEAYTRAQGMFRESGAIEAEYSDTLSLDMSTVVPKYCRAKAATGQN